jgi:hypothetical protein
MGKILLLQTQMVFFQEIHVFLQLRGNSLFGTKWALLPLKTMMYSQCSFQKLTQFSQGNNVLDAPDFNTNHFLSWDTCISSITWIGLFGKKWDFLHLEKPKFQVSLKNNSVFTGKQYARCSTLITYMIFFWELHVFLNSAE